MNSRILRLAVVVAALPALAACDVGDLMPWHGYYAASTSMEPTLRKGQRLSAWTVSSADLRRGDILVVDNHGEDYVMRLAGLPGDTVAMHGGVFMLNGKEIRQRPAGTWRIEGDFGPQDFTAHYERFPGEKQPHRILDDSENPFDEYPERKLGTDEFFLLGDNRDHSADSRFERWESGLSRVSGKQIKRRVDLDSIRE